MNTVPLGGATNWASLLAGMEGQSDMAVTALSADPTATATQGPLGMLGSYGGNLYVHRTDAADTNWINLSTIDSRIAAVQAAVAAIVIPAGLVKVHTMTVVTADIRSGANLHAGVATLPLSLAALGATKVLGVKATLNAQFHFTGIDNHAINFYVGWEGGSVDGLLRPMDVSDLAVNGTQRTEGSSEPTDADPSQINLKFNASGLTMEDLGPQGQVSLQFFYV